MEIVGSQENEEDLGPKGTVARAATDTCLDPKTSVILNQILYTMPY